jgi:AraC-like DNA-binding protein
MLQSFGILRGSIHANRPEGKRVLRQDFLAYLHRGKAIFESASHPARELEPGVAVFCPAGVPHRYDPISVEHWENYWILFESRNASERFELAMPDEPTIVPIPRPDKMIDSWLELERSRGGGESGPPFMTFHLHQIVFEIWRQIQTPSEPARYGLVERVTQCMRECIEWKDIDLGQLARKEGMGYHTFRAKFRQLAGISPHHCYLDMKIEAARDLLLDPFARVGDVSERLGFRDPYYFSRLFKKKTGESPSEYRTRRLGQT